MLLILLWSPSQTAATDFPVVDPTRCDEIVGTWRWFNGAKVECQGNGRCEATNGFSGPWRCLDPKGVVEIRWGRGGGSVQWIDTLNITSDGNKLSGTNQIGGSVSASRMATATSRVPLQAQLGLGAPATGHGAKGVALSRDQQETVKLVGWPDAFGIQRIIEDQGPVRYEAWTWLDSDLTYVFVEGKFRFVEPAGTEAPRGSATQLRPHRFRLGASVADIRALSPGERWERLPLVVDLPGWSLFLADGFVAIFRDDGLVGMEAQSPAVLLEGQP